MSLCDTIRHLAYNDFGHIVRNGRGGTAADISCGYDQISNLLKKVTDDAVGIHYTGAFDFVDGADLETEYTYNGNGAMTSDANKGIASIEYDNLNHPKRIQFTNGNVTRYVYSPDGMKLRAVHETAIANVVVPLGTSVALNSAQIDDADSTDYRGNCLYEDGVLSKYLFDGGYVSVSGTSTTAHYYVKDHLGNNRAVVNENGTLEQVTNYYPFGGVFSDFQNRLNPDLQPYKYNGKELDRTHNLDWYDYGARMYDPTIGMFTSVDPSAGEYCNVSPFAYCIGNPVRYVDPDGKKIFEVNQWGYVKEGRSCVGTYVRFPNNMVQLSASNNSYDKVLEQLMDKNKSFAITSEEQALIIQNVMTENTNVEWSASITKDGRGVITTNHEESWVDSKASLKSFDISESELKMQIHGHPGRNSKDGSMSEGTKGGSPADLEVAKGMPSEVRHFINHQGSGRIFEYDSRKEVLNEWSNFEEWRIDVWGK